jgi:glycosyltransferase involved in cell wall biosynthesis
VSASNPYEAATPPRVAQINSMLTGGGTDNQCVMLASALHDLGAPVWIAGPDARDFSPAIRRLGVPYHVTPPEGPLKLRYILNVVKLIRREKIQIVHGHHGRDIWLTILAGKLSGVRPKIVLTRHLAKSPGSWFSRRFMLGQCDAVVAVSQYVARVLREGVYEPESPDPERHSRPPIRGDHSKISVIHGGIDTERFKPFEAEEQRRAWGLEPGQFAFGIAGGYDLPRGKGQREFLKAAAKMHERAPSARFLVIGRGNMADILRGDIERLGLAGKAWLAPYCDDMPRAMNALNCLVHSQIGTEAFGLVVCEAFACGRPVIASALDGIPEAFAAGNYGRLVPPENIGDLAQAMYERTQQPAATAAERAALHEKIAAGHSKLAFGRRMLQLYGQLLGSHPQAAAVPR